MVIFHSYCMLVYQRVHFLILKPIVISHSFCGKMTWDALRCSEPAGQCSFTVLKGRQSWPGMSKSGRSGRWRRGIPLKIPLDSPSCESWLNCWDGTGSNWGSSPKIPSSQWKWPAERGLPCQVFFRKLWHDWPQTGPNLSQIQIVYTHEYIYIYMTIYIYI